MQKRVVLKSWFAKKKISHNISHFCVETNTFYSQTLFRRVVFDSQKNWEEGTESSHFSPAARIMHPQVIAPNENLLKMRLTNQVLTKKSLVATSKMSNLVNSSGINMPGIHVFSVVPGLW